MLVSSNFVTSCLGITFSSFLLQFPTQEGCYKRSIKMEEWRKLKWNSELIIISNQFLYYCILVPEFNILANLATIHPALGRRILMNYRRFSLLHFCLLGPYMYTIPVVIGLILMELKFSYTSSLSGFR